MNKLPFLLVVSLLATACSSSIPANATVKIKGIAPQGGKCELHLVQMAMNENDSWKRPVNGPFEETFLLSPQDMEYFIEGSCDDEVTYMNVFVFPAAAPLNIGKIKP